jgi:hypothetical protein
MSDKKVSVTMEVKPAGPTFFCLELGSQDGSDRYYFTGPGTQFDFEQKCNSFMPEAAKRALEADEKMDYHFVCWENIIEFVAKLLTDNGYTRVHPKMASYVRGMLNPPTPASDWNLMVKEGMAGSYELLGEWGPKITEHNLKHQE